MMETITKKYKESVLKSYDITMSEVIGYRLLFEGFSEGVYASVCFEVDNISQIDSSKFKKDKAVVVSGKDKYNVSVSIFLPEYEVAEVENLVDKIRKEKEDYELRKKQESIKKEQERIKREQKEKEQEIERQKLKQEILLFVKEEYLDIKEKQPIYVFEEDDAYVTFMYIDESKSIAIKSVEKLKKEMVESTIKYDDIHYYEKAGAIHYVTELNVQYQGQSFAGSFVPSKLKLTPAVVGGLLLGPMGLAVGAMMGYKPAHFEKTSNWQPEMNITSHVNKIDDRSVILNYYSEKYKQYMDIEFPQEIYNFLQTHIGEKKYDIVLEAEKKKYVSNVNDDSSIQSIEEKSKLAIEDKKMTLEEFEVAVKKLKIMLDNNLISEEEFNTKKMELFNNI